ncbi:MAG: hypothetical protein BWY83_03251 [bacterium ADurb.Bin478]|nr:MAG: hypothetical protein BWY83_03251 [bacterium ADurb.Bin478]
MNEPLTITPETKLGELLERYPQLEQTLLDHSPAFAKLKNPLLRRTVAKVATLQQVAQVGGVPLAQLINQLRAAVGQRESDFSESQSDSRPDWLHSHAVTASLDARPMLEAGEHPLVRVLNALKDFPAEAVFELVTPFSPAPLLEQVRQKGYLVFSETVEPELIKSYFFKPPQP